MCKNKQEEGCGEFDQVLAGITGFRKKPHACGTVRDDITVYSLINTELGSLEKCKFCIQVSAKDYVMTSFWLKL